MEYTLIFGQCISGVGGKHADVEWVVAKAETKNKITIRV